MKTTLVASLAISFVVSSSAAFADDAVEGQKNAQSAPPQTSSRQMSSTTTVTAAPVQTSAPITTTSAATTPTTTTAPVLSTSSESSRDTVELNQKIRPNRPILYTGGAMLAGAYVTTAAVNAAEDVDEALYIPVAGPWMHIASIDSDADATETALVVGSGVVQGVGALMTLASFFIPEKIPAATIQAGNMKFQVAPTATARGAGAAAVAVF